MWRRSMPCSDWLNLHEPSGWVRPKVDESHDLVLNGARHPVLESDPNFVPNDLTCTSKRRFTLITGPNMGGKSTYLRTAALVALLAQVGSHVPCDRATLESSIGSSRELARAMIFVADGPPSWSR